MQPITDLGMFLLALLTMLITYLPTQLWYINRKNKPMLSFYFQYDKDRHQAKVVFDGDPGKVEVYYVDHLECRVPVVSVLAESPKFVMRGECKSIIYSGTRLILTNKR